MRKARRPLRPEEMLSALRGEVARHRTIVAAATALDVSQTYLCAVLHGRRPISATIAHALGYERQFVYVPYDGQE